MWMHWGRRNLWTIREISANISITVQGRDIPCVPKTSTFRIYHAKNIKIGYFLTEVFEKEQVSVFGTRCSYNGKLIGNHTCPIEWHHYQWRWVTLSGRWTVMNLFHVNKNILGPIWVFALQWSKRKRCNACLRGGNVRGGKCPGGKCPTLTSDRWRRRILSSPDSRLPGTTYDCRRDKLALIVLDWAGGRAFMSSTHCRCLFLRHSKEKGSMATYCSSPLIPGKDRAG